MKVLYAAAALLAAYTVPVLAETPHGTPIVTASPAAHPGKHATAVNGAATKYVAAPPAHAVPDSAKSAPQPVPQLVLPEASGNSSNWLQGGGG